MREDSGVRYEMTEMSIKAKYQPRLTGFMFISDAAAHYVDRRCGAAFLTTTTMLP